MLDWSFFIENIEHNWLGFTKVHLIQDKAFKRTNFTVAAVLRAKKKQWTNVEDQLLEPNWIKVEKDLRLEISPTNQDII